ncbi:MAG: hypothetical protein DMF84_30320 [Acidobacteria bacterium]|nr:MAG: hypothetical protein DMF84_30320 [Acidobacteriota bacterium]
MSTATACAASQVAGLARCIATREGRRTTSATVSIYATHTNAADARFNETVSRERDGLGYG